LLDPHLGWADVVMSNLPSKEMRRAEVQQRYSCNEWLIGCSHREHSRGEQSMLKIYIAIFGGKNFKQSWTHYTSNLALNGVICISATHPVCKTYELIARLKFEYHTLALSNNVRLKLFSPAEKTSKREKASEVPLRPSANKKCLHNAAGRRIPVNDIEAVIFLLFRAFGRATIKKVIRFLALATAALVKESIDDYRQKDVRASHAFDRGMRRGQVIRAKKLFYQPE
jgi:hypothetical protein